MDIFTTAYVCVCVCVCAAHMYRVLGAMA